MAENLLINPTASVDLSGYFKLDQTTPQTVINGTPVFNQGFKDNLVTYINGGVSDSGNDSSADFNTRGLLNSNEDVTFNWNTLKFPTLTTNGFLKTSGSDGTIGVDTSTYILNGTLGDYTISAFASPAMSITDSVRNTNLYIAKNDGFILTGHGNIFMQSVGDNYLLQTNDGNALQLQNITGGTALELATDDGYAMKAYNQISATDVIDTGLTASKVVFSDAGKKLTSTGIGTSGQFIKGDGSLDSSTYLTAEADTLATVTARGATTATATSFTGGLTVNTVGLTVTDVDIILGTTTGTKIGTGTTQKLGFWNATPVVQQANTVALDTLNSTLGLRASGGYANFATTIQPRTGTASANTAPLKFTSGTLLSSAEAGAVEFLTDKYYGTITTGAARKEFALNDTALTSGRVPIVTTNGRLTDDADMTFATDTLTVTKIVGTTSITDSALTSGRVIIASTAGLLADNANLTYNTGTGALTVAAGTAQNLMGTGLHINTANGSTAVYDTQIEGDTDANLLYVDASADKVGVGVAAPSAKLHIISTTEQLRLGYDASNYKSETVGSTGSVTTALTGTSPINIFSQAVKFAGGTQSSDGSAGLSATYNFDATTSGNITSMTFKNGLLTAVTTLP